MTAVTRSTFIIAMALAFAALPDLRGEAPAGYYDSIEGKIGGELKQALNQIIRRDNRNGAPQHAVIPYGSLMQPLREIWRDPSTPINILQVYSSSSVLATSSTWNREHLWPRARGNSDNAGPDESDLFHVVPSDTQVNGKRGNLYFDASDTNDAKYEVGAGVSAPLVTYDSDSWEPPPSQRGDIARAMFYMDVRYNGADPLTTDLELVSFPPSSAQMGNLNRLLLWHAEDPPDDAEQKRNNLIYSTYQGNRNPFIDRPELVDALWSAPFVRVELTVATAVEATLTPAKIEVLLNQTAGSDGVLVQFSASGTATSADYTLSGNGLVFNASTGVGSVLVPPGQKEASIVLLPVADQLTEVGETVKIGITAGSAYHFTPDSSSFASVNIEDAGSLPVSWNFNSFSPSDKVLAGNVGSGFISFSNWTGAIIATNPGQVGNSLTLAGSGGNNSWIDFNFSMLGYRDLGLSFSTRGSASGFTTGTWSYSIDGLNFTTYEGLNTATTSGSWSTRNVNFSSFLTLNNTPSVTIRYTLSGASSIGGNNRLDELIFSATPYIPTSNDAFNDAYVLSGFPASATGTNDGATFEPDEYWHFGDSGGASVWWRWTAPTDGLVSVSTDGSTFDTILAIYTGSELQFLVPVASDDESGEGNASRVTFQATAGTTYRIAVDGFASATGNIVLSVGPPTAPEVYTFNPGGGLPGVQVTLEGQNFTGATAVSFGGVAASSFTVLSDNLILAVVPEDVVSGPITVARPSGTGESSGWFEVAARPSVASATPDRGSVSVAGSTMGQPSLPSSFSVTAQHLPASLTVAAPPGFEVSHDGTNFAAVLEIAAPERFDAATNYAGRVLSGSNGGNGFSPWLIGSWEMDDAAGLFVANPSDSGITDFGDQAFSPYVGGVPDSWSSTWVQRSFASPLAVGESFSFAFAANAGTNTDSFDHSFYLNSVNTYLVGVHRGAFSGTIFIVSPSSDFLDTGIPADNVNIRWSFRLINSSTLRVQATQLRGGSQVLFSQDLPVSGSPDGAVWFSYGLGSNPQSHAYFNDLRIDSASPGGGSFGAQTVYVRLAANAPAGNLSGALSISSAGQPLASVAVSGVVTGGNPYDVWAQSHGLDLQGNGARGADPDGDGHSNLREFLFGASPAQVTGSLWRHEMQGSGLVLTFVGRETGATYKLMSTGNLSAGTWVEETLAINETISQEGVPGGHKRRQVVVPNPSGNRFFRLQATETQ